MGDQADPVSHAPKPEVARAPGMPERDGWQPIAGTPGPGWSAQTALPPLDLARSARRAPEELVVLRQVAGPGDRHRAVLHMQRLHGNCHATRTIERSRAADHDTLPQPRDTPTRVLRPYVVSSPGRSISSVQRQPDITGVPIQRGWTDDLGDLVNEGVDMASGAAGAVADTASSAASAVGEAASDAASAVGDAASAAAGAVSDAASDIAAGAQALVTGAISQLRSAYDAIAGQVSAAWDTLKGGIEAAITAAMEEATGFLGGIGGFFSGVGQAIVDLDAEKLRGAWSAITATANMLLGSVKGIAARVLAVLDGQWNNVKGMADGLIGSLRERAEGIIGELPSAVQGAARSVWGTIESKATGAWATIEKGWTSARKWASDKLDEMAAGVERIVDSVNESVIAPVVDTLTRVGEIFKVVKRAMDDPEGFIQPMVEAVMGMLQDLPGRARTEAQKYINAAGTGGPVAAPAAATAGPTAAPATAPPAQRTIQRDAAKPGDPRSTLGVGDLLSVVWDALGEKITKLWGNLGATVKEMLISMVWPPATWAALKQDWADMVKELSTRAARFEGIRTDSFGAFWEDLTRFLSNLTDFPLIIWRSANAMLGRLSFYIGVALILGGAVAGAISGATGGAVFGSVVPVAGNAAGGVGGFFAGAWAGAQAGYAAAETVGLVLLASFAGGEVANISKAVGDLLFLPQTKEEQDEDVNNIADSTIAVVSAALLIAIAFGAVALAKKIWALAKSIFSRFRLPKPKVVEPVGPKPVDPADPTTPKPAETPPGRPDKLVICRVCDIVPGVPEDLMAQRAALSPEARAILDAKAAKFFPDPLNPTPDNFKALRGFMESTARKGGDGGLEEGLKKLAPKPPTKGTPTGPRAADLPKLRGDIEGLIAQIDDFAKANPDNPSISRMSTKMQQLLDGPVQRMENGVDVATDDLVKTVQRQLKGGQGELERAKVAPKGTEFSGEIDGIEFDQIRPNGDLIQVKKMRALRRGARTYNDTVKQINQTLEVAQRHPVDGQPRKVTIEFPEGLSKEVGDDFRAIEVNGQKATIVAEEIIVPPK